MEWSSAQLGTIAPARPCDRDFEPNEEVWQLGLDQIESHTGAVLLKKRKPASEAGNSTFVFDRRHVLYSKLRPYLNKVVVPDEAGIGTTELIGLVPDASVLDRRFLGYYLRSPGFLRYATHYVSGAKMPRIIMRRFWEHKVPLPPLAEQRRIVEILDHVDHLRRLRTESDTKSARIVSTLFLKVFGDPATNSMRWKTTTLGSVLQDIQYGTSKRANSTFIGVPVMRMNNITTTGQLDLRNLKYVELGRVEQKKYKLRSGDILFNRRNSRELVGKTALWNGEMDAVAASYLIRARVVQKKARPEFIWAYMNSAFMKALLFEKARHAIGMANINAKELGSLPLMLPPLDAQETFARHIKRVRSVENHWSRARETASQLWSLLLHAAFSGTLTSDWRGARRDELRHEGKAKDVKTYEAQ